jgi:hypothetical protein
LGVNTKKKAINYFDFDESIPVNKVDEENLYWLDETDAQYKECQ